MGGLRRRSLGGRAELLNGSTSLSGSADVPTQTEQDRDWIHTSSAVGKDEDKIYDLTKRKMFIFMSGGLQLLLS